MLTIDRYAHLVGGAGWALQRATASSTADQRAWEVPNLFIADGSVLPTQGSANPALTIMALASRLGEGLAGKRIAASSSAQER